MAGGQDAIANAKLAYVKFKEIFSTSRFQAWRRRARECSECYGIDRNQEPHYSDTLYIDTLIGPDTVNTMPVASLEAYRDHGKPAIRIEEGLEESRAVMQKLAEEGIDVAAITRKLEDQGVESFTKDYEKLLASINEKRRLYV